MRRQKHSPEYIDFIRDFNRHMNEVLDSSDKQFLIHSLKQYFTYKDIEKFTLSLESCLNTSRKRDLLLKIRNIIGKQDLVKFDAIAPYNQKRSHSRNPRPHHSYPRRTRRHRSMHSSVDPVKERQTQSVAYSGSRKVRVVRIPGSEEELGFNVRGGKDFGVGIYVSGVEKGRLADQCGLKPGDQILEVNGIDFTNLPHSTAVKVLKSRGNLNLMVQRVGLIPRDRSGETHFIWIDPLTGKPIKGSTSVEPAEDNAYEMRSDLQLMTRTDERKVLLKVSAGGSLGLSIRGGREYGLGIYLSSVDEGSAAQEAGLRVGDQIMRVNNFSLHNISHERAVQVLKSYTHLMLTIRNVGRIPHTFKPSKPSYDSSTFPQSRNKKIRPALKDMAHRNTMDGLSLPESGKERYPDKKYSSEKTVSIQEEEQIIPERLDRSNWDTRKKASLIENPDIARVRKTEKTAPANPPSPVFSRFVGGLTTLSNQGLSQSREMLLDRTRKFGGEGLVSDVKAAIKKYDDNQELEPFARFFRDMDSIPEKKSIIQDARCVLEPRHVDLFDRIVAYRPEQTSLKPSKRISTASSHSGSGFSRPGPRERPPHVHKLPPSLLNIFENQRLSDILDHPHDPFESEAARLKTSDSFSGQVPRLKQEKGTKVLVEIFKNSPTLGLSISGGSDTPNSEVIIEEVKPGGAAFSDGFLKPGFEIVSVNSIPLQGHTHREIVEKISRAFADSHTLKMVVIPDVTAN